MLVFTSGSFDLMHPGHVEFLRLARALGDRLVVGLASDSSVVARKGPERPLIPQAQRATMLRAIRWVDDVIVFADYTPTALLERLKPDIYAQGEKYRHRVLPGSQFAGQVVYLDVNGWSTARLLARIREQPLPPLQPGLREKALRGLLRRLERMGVRYRTDCDGWVMVQDRRGQDAFYVRVGGYGQTVLAGRMISPPRDFFRELMLELERCGCLRSAARD